MLNADNNIKTTLLGSYLDSTATSKLDTKTIFKKLSIDMGGDGKKITKDQLDGYIKKAESDKVNISDEELNGLKTMQKKWNQIAKGGDNISYSNMHDFKDILKSMDTPTKTPSIPKDIDAEAATVKVYKYLISSAIFGENSDTSKANLKSMLNSMLTGTTDENDDANANMIGALTNLLAQSNKNSTIETEA